MANQGYALLGDDGAVLPAQASFAVKAAAYNSANSATTITLAGTFYVLQGTTTAEFLASLFTHASPGRLTYTGTPTKQVQITALVSFSASANNILTKWRIAKNGATIAASETQQFKGTGANIETVVCHATVSLATNDYIEIFCTNDSAGSTMTAVTSRLEIL